MHSASMIFLAVAMTSLVCIYFLPWLVAKLRDVPSSAGIFWLNLLFGWTFLGWFILLAVTMTAAPKIRQTNELGALRWV